MKSRNRVLLSCIVASLVTSSGYAVSVCNPATTITVNDANTTGIVLKCYDSLNVASIGSVKVSATPNMAVYSTSTGDITNSGVIEGNNSSDGNSYGINQYMDDGIDNTITNSGTISATSTNSGSSKAVGISQVTYYGDINGAIANSGTISATGKNAIGIYQSTEEGGDFTGTITNSGTIMVHSLSGQAVGIYQRINGDINGTITNSGTIVVDGSSGYAVGIRQNFTGMSENGVITNTSTGSITAQIAFALRSDGASSLILNQGTIDTSFIGASGSTLINSGMLKLHEGFDSHVRNFTQTSTGTLSIDADFVAGDGFGIVHPRIIADNNASIADESTIYVNVIGGGGLEQAMLDQNKTIDGIVMAGVNMSVNPENLVVDDNSSILDFEAYMNAENSLGLKLIEDAGTPPPPPPTPVVTPEERPEVVVATPTLGAETLNVLNTIVQKREYSASGLGGGDMAFVDKHFWFKPFGVYTKQNDKNGKNGFDANTYGFGIGVDGEYAEGKRAGLSFFYSNSSLDINNVRQESDLDAFNFIVYGSQPILDDKSRLFYQGGFGFQKNTSKRYLTSQTAKADYTSRSFYAQVKAVKYYNINDKLTITPAVEGSYRYFYTPSYSETGAGALNLNVQSSSTSQVLFGVLTKLEYKIDDNTHFMSNIALTYDFNNDASSVNASYQGGGAIFNTAGIKNSALSYELGLGIARKINKNMVIDVKYDLYGKGNDFINHAILAKLKWNF